MQREYEMTEDDLRTILGASKPVPYMIFGGVPPRSPQQNANDAWAALGRKMGFKEMTVRPIADKGNRFFTADAAEAELEKP